MPHLFEPLPLQAVRLRSRFERLERAVERRDPNIGRVKLDPFLRKIRGDPRYAALLAKMKLPMD